MDRRTFLTSASVAGITGLAGCAMTQDPPTAPEDAAAWPRVDPALLDGWNEYDRLGLSLDKTLISQLDFSLKGTSNTIIYENADLRSRIRADTLGNLNAVMMAFIATKITIHNDFVGRLVPLDEINTQIRDAFWTNLSEFGLEEIEVAETTKTVTDRIRTEYEATFVPDPVELGAVDLPEIGPTEFPPLKPKSVPVHAFIETWKNDSTFFMAGGVYPAKDQLVTQSTTSITGENAGDGIDINLSVTLNFTPEEYRQTLGKMAQSVE
jgi:hypothetical protein